MIQKEQSKRDRLIDANITCIDNTRGDPDERPVRDRLIDATIACIKSAGIHTVTIRTIAEEAGLNSAAINYYFGTKDKLVEEALRQAMAHTMASFEMLEEQGRDSFDVLQGFFRHYFEGIVDDPEIYKAHFYNLFIKNEYDPDKMDWFHGFLSQLMEVIKKFLPEADELDVKVTVMQLVSSMLVPGILPGLYRETLGMDMKNPEVRRKYIDYLLDRYIGRDKLKGE